EALCAYLAQLDDATLAKRVSTAEQVIRLMGITFRVYGEDGGSIDRHWPYDLIPRILPLPEWRRIEDGLKQRVLALNLFIDDVYHDQRAFADGVIPRDLLATSRNFRPECMGVSPPHGVWAHICGSDLVRDRDGTVYVLEDNLRVPSGVSYMLENRKVTKRSFPELFRQARILPVDDYPLQLYAMLASVSPRPGDQPRIVVLTPGIYNSAYYEHSYLAQRMGVELVTAADLFVDDDDRVQMRTISGPRRVDVIYRRIDDLFLDPEAFLPDSMLGVPGLMRAWRAGHVALVNAPGAGVADDKVVYTYVPALIRYYLDAEPILPNVPSFRCVDARERDHVLANMDKLVVKAANESGGYGLIVGPHATPAQRDAFAEAVRHDPRNYMAQPMLTLSTVPTIVGTRVAPRHVDLRPFVLSGERIEVTAGGLTRVALVEGSTVVNSSQGGGSKDTWVVDLERRSA
ncbi:MAG TPA: circularly permuted type 2 ATP-grasp protein, partial [Archangium sp.]|uniref:circularly permuted type 2 ATP-grasp protein n=1 Tax=Archangium sp. TaxID=1872627 RepID=UPI002ED9A61F